MYFVYLEDDLSPGGDPKDLFQFTDEAALQDSQDSQENVPDLQLNMVESFPAPTDTELNVHYGKSGLYSDDDEFCIIDEPWMGSAVSIGVVRSLTKFNTFTCVSNVHYINSHCIYLNDVTCRYDICLLKSCRNLTDFFFFGREGRGY